MTKEQFDTVDVGDVLLAQNGRHMYIDKIIDDILYFSWDTGNTTDHYTDFAYTRHISKGTTYGTHRTLRYKADFKTKP